MLALPLLVLFAAAPATDAAAEALVARHLSALGGEARLRAITSIRGSGKLVLGDDGYEAAFGWAQKRPASTRWETTVQGLTEVTAFDGKEGWTVQPFGGRTTPEHLAADQLRGLARDADLDGPLVDHAKKGHQLRYLGTEDVDGTGAHKLEVRLADGDTLYVYLDPDSLLQIRTLTVSRVRGTERVSETDYGDYRQVAGVWMAFSMESGAKGGPKYARTQIERLEVNAALDDALFRFPAPGARTERALAPVGAPTPAGAAPPSARAAVRFDAGVVSGLGARNIGSAAMSGRISAVAAFRDAGRTTVYVGAASGGVWKSTDGGTTLRPVFDRQPVQSIGAIAIDPSRHETVWVGTGEAWTRNSVSIGNGIYKSTDGGETWTHQGLPESERIARIVVHPKNGDVVYACVPGKLWSDSAERGLYRTSDGGKTWARVLAGPNLSTGCSSVALDPSNPDVVMAGLWDFRRKAWSFRSGGDGPDAASGSGLFRSADGGKTFQPVTAGLPPGPWGRVEIAYAESAPRIVYAFVESKDSALYRSTDGGKTWAPRDKSRNMVWRPFYFARLVVDPTNPDRVFKPNLGLIVSEDGGKSFQYTGGASHGDWHDLWIDPKNPKHLIGGDDGGLWISNDGGSRWWKCDNLPVSQFYHVATDGEDPYHVLGGLQDNGSWIGDSAHPGGVSNQRWEPLYGSDGFWTIPDPFAPDIVYAEGQGGYVARIDRKTGAARDIQPKAGYGEKLRFNWNTPIHASPTRKGTIYLGSQFLFRSRDRGDSWERISPDLTSNDPGKQQQERSGGVTVDNSSAEMHTTIYAIAESPRSPEVIWVGTDDGRVQLTRDGGKRWTDLTANVAGLPPASWVSWLEPSRFDAGTAYAAFDRHTTGDTTPWVYRTTDFGKTWTRLVDAASGVRGYAHTVREDPVQRGLLFVGTELGLWISIDAGRSWAEFKGGGFPAVAVREVQVHPREHDLVIGTHGRGIWVVDDLTPLRALSAEALGKEVALLPGRPVQQRMPATGGWVEGDAHFVGDNPPSGAVLTYYQRARHVFGPMKLEILDATGKVIDTVPTSKRRGLVRVQWTMRLPAPRVPRAAQVAGASTYGPRVAPGTYTARLQRGADVATQTLEVRVDRRAPYGAAERKAHLGAMTRVHALFGAMSDLVDRIQGLRMAAAARGQAAGEPLAGRLRTLRGR